MFTSKPFLCIDFGMGSLKLAQFTVETDGSLRLLRYGLRPVGPAGAQEASRQGAWQRGLREWLAEDRVTAQQCSASLPALHVFSKFVKVVFDSHKAEPVLAREAQHSVPFPLEQAVWDWQTLATLPSGERELVLAASRTELVEGLVRTAQRANLRLDLVDASPAALANAFLHGYGDLAGGSALLDIGARTSNLLLFDGQKMFWRSLNLGASAITEGFAAEAGMPFAEAEKTKIAEGCVGLGGACAEEEDPRRAALAKVARQVMTRLHLQVNQTIQFFCAQHGGTAPQRLFLAGGAARMPNTARFFAEKLDLPVEYFNPFRGVALGPAVNPEELGQVAHALGEVVGLALRRSNRCPVELDLTPPIVLRQRQSRLTANKLATIADRKPRVDYLQRKLKKLNLALARKNQSQRAADQLTACMSSRFYWADLLADFQRALAATEARTRRPGIRANIWIEKMTADVPEADEEEEPPPLRPLLDLNLWKRYFPEEYARAQQLNPQGFASLLIAGQARQTRSTPELTNTISTIRLTCRAVSWSRVAPSADSELAYAFLEQLQASPYSLGGADGTRLSGPLERDKATGTFSFEAKLVLKQPIKL
jgi:type IV pilus assembly protein PilM